MTTIREKSTAALAEALHTATGSGCLHEDGYGGTGWVQCDKDASWVMECSPTLARRLDFGTAWDEAVAALPDGWVLRGVTYLSDSWEAWADDPSVGHLRREWRHAYGPTPTEALVALTEKLREAQR